MFIFPPENTGSIRPLYFQIGLSFSAEPAHRGIQLKRICCATRGPPFGWMAGPGLRVGSGIFKAGANLEPAERIKAQARRATAIVESVLFYQDPKRLAEISKGLGDAMVGINCSELPDFQRMASRGW